MKATDILRIFLGLVFLSAGIFRIFNWQQAILELSNLKLETVFLPILLVILEIGTGIFLILNFKTKKALSVLIIFLGFALVWTLANYGKTLISNSYELFTFQANPTDFFLHLTYLAIIIYLFLSLKEKE